MKKTLIPILLLSLAAYPSLSQQWQELIDPKLEGWKKIGGEAVYRYENGTIIGTTQENTPNTFLTSQKYYDDFILEYEVWVDPDINSGVQIRSNSIESYMNGRVHGYQVELDPSSRSYSGGIYDEARRKWLYPLSRNEMGRNAFRNGQWNKFRVEAIGNRIQTWINGVQCANLTDDLTSKGFIGLQVHSVRKGMANKEVKWRNIRILTENIEKYKTPSNPNVPEHSYLVNELSEQEKRKGWRLLWDGKTSTGWKSAYNEEFPSSGWEITDGVLTINAAEDGSYYSVGDIITRERFSDFELELEFKLTEGANSGLKYYAMKDPKSGFFIGSEFQILDDKNHPDAKNGVAGNRTLGSLYDLIAAENLSRKGANKDFKGIGDWNKLRIVSKNGKVEHWLNHLKVVEYDRSSQIFKALVSYSKYADYENFGQWPEGHILLQDHGNTVHFRSIKIREF